MKLTLNRVNTLLLIAIVCINGYIIAAPFAPRFAFWLERNDSRRVRTLEQAVSKSSGTSAPTKQRVNQLIIPSMVFEEAVHTGSSAKTLNQGLWLRPQGSTPDQGGNTVIVGHRFTYTNPHGVLYHLDTVRPGDTIGLSWEGTMYRYKVSEVKTVSASQTDIEAPSTKPRLTIYTCTPLWLPKDRLVVVAEAA